MESALLARYQLPEGVDDADMNRGQLAQAFGVSTNTIDKWRVDGMPVEQEGTNGTSYVFRLSHCWAWREARTADERAVKAAGDQSAHQMRLHFLNLQEDASPVHLSATQRIAELEAELKYNKAARERRELIHTAEVEPLLASMMGAFRSGVQGLPDWAERELGLTPQQVTTMIAYCDEILNGTANQIEAFHLLKDQAVYDRPVGRLL